MPVSKSKWLWSGICLLCAFANISTAQNLEQLGWKKGVKVSGSVSANTILYSASEMKGRRDPFNWSVNGNLNISLFGYDAPFSFSYSNQQRSFSQPFNTLSFTPQYKWVKAYLGYTAMSFSNYTLAGHMFLGAGVELTPGKWRLAAMYGRLKKEVPFNVSDSQQQAEPAFRRMGYGVKAGYGDERGSIDISVFAAKDDKNSLLYIPKDALLYPQENVAVSIAGKKTFLRHFFVDVEYAVSMLNKDIRADTGKPATGGANLFKGLLKGSPGTRYYDAVNAGIGYNGAFYSLQLRYERIAPDYQTLGAYYFNNDMRNITIAPTLRLMHGRLSLAGNIGMQTNNLDSSKAHTNKRFVGSANATFVPSDSWNFNLNYSNFTSHTRARPLNDPFFQNPYDTLNFYQVNNNVTGMVNYLFGSRERRHSIMMNVSYQRASDNSAGNDKIQLSDYYTGNLGYNYMLTPLDLTLGTSFNYYDTRISGVKSIYWGPGITAGKLWWHKTINTSFVTTYNQTKSSGEQTVSSKVSSTRLSIGYMPKPRPKDKDSRKITGRHNLGMSVSYLKQFGTLQLPAGFSELTTTMNYTLSF
ncbi:hypothetical protein [Chitinophaga solisilvae]|uniref:hypothetical protein n=1 Tax=Chitinophaga solisilvae TaxID=1233460 RepID=UPI001367ADA1|nr:hypothetical protein [Chitinophaga solisilvae]